MNRKLLKVNRLLMWANVREFDDGLRLRLPRNDWQQLNFDNYERLRVVVSGQAVMWLRVAAMREWPPNVVITLTNRAAFVPE
ncbi:MAG: hypothetical protein U0792_02730 [Gemmataceae bacterium]